MSGGSSANGPKLVFQVRIVFANLQNPDTQDSGLLGTRAPACAGTLRTPAAHEKAPGPDMKKGPVPGESVFGAWGLMVL